MHAGGGRPDSRTLPKRSANFPMVKTFGGQNVWLGNRAPKREAPPNSMQKPSATLKRVLLTFVGSHDPWRGGASGTGDGPVLSLLHAEKFDSLHLFYNNE